MSAKYLYSRPTPFTDNQVTLESNRPVPGRDNLNQWALFLVRRGHPVRQLAVNVGIVTIQSSVVHLSLLLGQWALLTYMALWALLTIMCGLSVITDTQLSRHAVIMFVLLVSGAIVGII